MLTVGTLVQAGVSPTQARTFLAPLEAACDRFDINTPARQGAFIAQCMVESQGFQHLEESLYYRTAERIRQIFPNEVSSLLAASALVGRPEGLANLVYANRNGNGPPVSGDGWRYRGRGLFQLTGRHNYSDAGTELARPYLEFPDVVALPEDACLTAAWFFSCAKGNLLADAGLIDSITKAINGPRMLQADLRRQWTEECARAFA